MLAVAGPPGAGKTTLGAALAAVLRLPLLDLDELTNPLLDALAPHLPGPPRHWNDAAWRPVVRPARYRVLCAAATAQVAAGSGAVLVAPFTAELTGGVEWRRLCAAVAPLTPVVCRLDAPPELLAARLLDRGADRDAHVTASSPEPPGVPFLPVDATLPTTDQVALVLSHLASG